MTTAPSGVPARLPAPPPGESWHPAALQWYESLSKSGQAVFYEPSDWAQAWVWAELLSRQMHAEAPSAGMVSAWASGATELLTTEGARRRARLELERAGSADEDENAAVTALDEYRQRFSG